MVGLVLSFSLMQLAFARPVKFADYYRMVFNGQDVGHLSRFVSPAGEAENRHTEIYLTLQLNQPPDFNPQASPLPSSATLLEHIQRMVAENNVEHIQRMVAENNAHLPRMPCVLTLIEQSLIIELGHPPDLDCLIWQVNLNNPANLRRSAILENGNVVERQIVEHQGACQAGPSVEVDEALRQDVPLTLLGGLKDMALRVAPQAQATIEHVYIFGATMEYVFERLMAWQRQGRSRTLENPGLFLFINPFTASVNRSSNIPSIQASSQILRYDPLTNTIFQEEHKGDPHPSHERWEYQLNKAGDQVIKITFVREEPDGENNYSFTFSSEPESNEAAGQAGRVSNSSNEDPDEDDGHVKQ
ncbi:hypothetical protein GZ77_08860 [Endozoicomonas montiporae]|uniref:Uncharacterized protein n=3 Tax=Endozoicomonas montiporae TaxID=1027273 RepID=A0A081N7N9_9GAMM|nr:hypothetical protein EZMO1_1518 [Endozoicomonas montiporae CL-33]KEQ14462.1 hypothetical protein GZ77_08860 [Endozoicomonas montiporae]